MSGYNLIQCNMLLDILGNAYQINKRSETILTEALELRYMDMTYIYGLLQSGGRNIRIGGLKNGFWATNQIINAIRNMNENQGFKLFLLDNNYQNQKFKNLCKLRTSYIDKINQMGINNSGDGINYVNYKRLLKHSGEDIYNDIEYTGILHNKALEIWQKYYENYLNLKNLLTAKISYYKDILITIKKYTEPRKGSLMIGIMLYKADMQPISMISTNTTKWVKEINGEWIKVDSFKSYKTIQPTLMLVFNLKENNMKYIGDQLQMELILQHCHL